MLFRSRSQKKLMHDVQVSHPGIRGDSRPHQPPAITSHTPKCPQSQRQGCLKLAFLSIKNALVVCAQMDFASQACPGGFDKLLVVHMQGIKGVHMLKGKVTGQRLGCCSAGQGLWEQWNQNPKHSKELASHTCLQRLMSLTKTSSML